MSNLQSINPRCVFISIKLQYLDFIKEGHNKSVLFIFFCFTAKQMIAINLKGSASVECTPVTSGHGIEKGNDDSKEEEESKKEAESLIATYNEAMDNLSIY